MIGRFSKRPAGLGVADGRFAPCGSAPNCVSSHADGTHFIEPFSFLDTPEAAWARVAETVGSQPRARIVTQTDRYLHAEFTSAFFRFVDDVELLLEPAAGLIHVRSASRIGYNDLGVNRRRVETLRKKWESVAR
jgi:uncharacterized protein (DUF1499 family)